jgi:hypothetical protein
MTFVRWVTPRTTRLNVRYGSLADIVQRPRMSALPPKADIRQRALHVRYGFRWRDSILRFGSAKRDLCKNAVVLLTILVEPDAAKRSITLHCLDRHPRPARIQLNNVTWLESCPFLFLCLPSWLDRWLAPHASPSFISSGSPGVCSCAGAFRFPATHSIGILTQNFGTISHCVRDRSPHGVARIVARGKATRRKPTRRGRSALSRLGAPSNL